MDKLFPIIRRVRRPLLPAEVELPRSASFTSEKQAEPKHGETPAAPPAAPKETPDDAGTDS